MARSDSRLGVGMVGVGAWYSHVGEPLLPPPDGGLIPFMLILITRTSKRMTGIRRVIRVKIYSTQKAGGLLNDRWVAYSPAIGWRQKPPTPERATKLICKCRKYSIPVKEIYLQYWHGTGGTVGYINTPGTVC